MPDCLTAQHGKYLVIQGVRFAYGHEQVLAALQSNADYAGYRREHGEKAARTTSLGQAVSYRFKRDGKGWRVFATMQLMDVPVVTDQERGRHRGGSQRRAPGRCGNRHLGQLRQCLQCASGHLWQSPASD